MNRFLCIKVLCFCCLLFGFKVNAESKAVWLDMSQKVNPVARPLDKLILCVRGCVTSKNFKWNMTRQEDSKFGYVANYSVESINGKNSGFASLRTGFLEKIQPIPVGVRWVVHSSRPEVISLAAYKGFSRRKGFYRARLMGQRSVTVAPGWQNIDILWKDLGISSRQYNLVNGFGFTVDKAPFELKVAKIELLFDSSSKAEKYKSAKDKKLSKLLRVMRDCVVARGVNIKPVASEKSVGQAEQNIWNAMQLIAIGEQINIWQRLASYNHLNYKAEADKLIYQKNKLTRNIEAGKTGEIKNELTVLQQNTDSFINSIIAQVPENKRRWKYGKDTRFYRPDGRPYRMFGPFFFRSLYAPPRDGLLWRPWDLRYLSALGFNGIRIVITWKLLEPEEGKFNQVYLKMLKEIMREAERYGMGVSIDLHWPYPHWFVKGKLGDTPTDKLNHHNSYHWPEALQDSWGRLAHELKDIPNIIAFEVPTNETPIAKTSKGVMASPVLMKYWNQWLKHTYGSRERLEAVWNAAVKGTERYSLGDDENWDNNTIRPLGFQNDKSIDEAYASNPRLQDHLRWTAWMQVMQTDGIMKQIRKSIPDAKGMMQRTIGDVWDHSPVPINYRSIQTSVGDNVLAGTHYGMGSIQARKAATLSLGSYDSEQQMENNFGAVKRHIKLGLGFCPFAFHYRGGGGMLLADDDWHLKPEVAYLSSNSNMIKNYWPVPLKGGVKVAVIVNSRLEATIGRAVDKVIKILDQNGCRTGVFESMRIAKDWKLLNGYELVVTCSNYIDPRLLSILKNKYKGYVLLNGRLDIDAYARNQKDGLPALLVKDKLFLRKSKVDTFAEASGNIDLAGYWDWAFAGKKKDVPRKVPSGLKWKKMAVPGMWGEVDITGSRQFRIGDGWYRKSVVIPQSWKGRKLFLNLGGVDDIDWVFFNGKLIGKTGTSTQNYWMVSRTYEIPSCLIKRGKKNELYICVRNIRGDGGLWKSPVSISANLNCTISWGDDIKNTPVECSSNMTLLKTQNLLGNVKVIGKVKVSGINQAIPAFLRQGNWYWWIGEYWNNESESDRKVVKTVLDRIRK